MTPEISVLIVNYNAGTHLERCVTALRAQTLSAFEAIVIDNASGDTSFNRARDAAGGDKRFRFVALTENSGFAAGNNHAASLAGASLLATLNPDAFPEPDWLERLSAAAGEHPEVAMFGSTQRDASDPDRIDGAGDRYWVAGIPWREQNESRLRRADAGHDGFYETFAPCAAAALYRADAFRAVGGFDERYFCFVEDVDLGFRLRLRGETCLQVRDAAVLHVGGGAGGGQSEFARYHGTRNLIWCFFSNMPAIAMPVALPLHLTALIVLAVKALWRGDPGPTLRGIRDGFAGPSRKGGIRARRATTRGIWSALRAMDWTPLPYLRRRR